MVRVGAANELAETPEDVAPGRLGAWPEPEHGKGPALFVFELAREPRVITAEIGDEALVALALPAPGAPEKPEDRTPRPERESSRGVHRAEDLRQGRAVTIDVERQRFAHPDELVAAAVEAVRVVLEAVAKPGLGDRPTALEFLHQAVDSVALLVLDVRSEGADHAGEKEATEAGRGLGRQVDVAQSDAPGRGDRPGMPDLQLGQEHVRRLDQIAGIRSRGQARCRAYRSTRFGRVTVSNNREAPDRNLAMELVRVTEAAAMAAARWMGRGDKEAADGAAVDAMRLILATVSMDGIVVIGEGEKDEAPMLYNGERIGTGEPPETDIAVDPIDGTTLTALGRGNALAVIAASERGQMFNPGPCVYMEKIAVGPEAASAIDITQSPTDNLKAVAKAKNESVRDLTAVILDRDRHADLIGEVRSTGARVRLISDGDVAGAISTAWPDSGADILFGVGGTPEGVIAAAALKCMGGAMQGKLWARNDEERTAAISEGYDLDAVLTIDDLVRGDNCFFAATGITDGELLRGVHYDVRGPSTQSLVMRSKSGTVRRIDARHRLDKLDMY